MNTFEDYLMEQFLKDYHGHKDGFLDTFDQWLEKLDVAEWIKMGEEYGK